MFKKLNEELEKILEGDVVSFADFKKKKEAQPQTFADLDAQVTRNMSNTCMITINKIFCVWSEGRIDGKNRFEEGKEYSYEEFQTMAYEFDFANQICDALDKVKFDAYVTMDYKGQHTDEKITLYLLVGDANEGSVNVIHILERYLKGPLMGDRVIVMNEPVYKDELDLTHPKYADYKVAEQQKKDDEAKAQAQKKKNTLEPKDYTKDVNDVEVGDILYCKRVYTMELADFYRVIKRTKRCIQLEKLDTVCVEGDGWSGLVMPIDKTVKDDNVDGKSKLIGVKGSKDAVCIINGYNSACYWDGKPKPFDHRD